MNNSLLVMILKNLVIFPHQEIKIELKDKNSQKIIKVSQKKYNDKLLVVAPNDAKEIEPSVDDLPMVGVIANIKSSIELSNGNLRVTLKGEKRVRINEYTSFSEDILACSYKDIVLPKYDKLVEEATVRKLKEILKSYINMSSGLSNSILKTMDNVSGVGYLSDVVATFLSLSTSKKLFYMQELNGLTRANKLIEDINLEIKMTELDLKIEEKLQIELNKSQTEFYLKEKINEIKKELGETSYKEEEVKRFNKILDSINVSDKTYEKIKSEIEKYEFASEASPEASVIRNYLDWILSLPWNKSSKEVLNAKKVLTSLNKSHYGLEEIKERITDYVSVKKINENIKNPVLCLIGPPGVGKTTIASSIAKSMDREFFKISVGGLNDSTELIGSRRTYLGALPGKFIQALRKCGTNNPVILIDEVDKMVKDYKGDPASTLLDIIDSNSNSNFIDNYIEEPFDLSHVLFVLTANNKDDIPYPLLDRLEIIDLNSYTMYEKLDITKKYLIPRITEEYNINKNIIIEDQDLINIINNYTKEAGVRDLSRVISKLVRKSLINDNYVVTKEVIEEYLGNPLYLNEINKIDKIGMVNALATTLVGGVVMPVEASIFKGNEKIILTGSLGDVMKESVNVALSYLKSSNYIDNEILKDKDIHLHFLSAAVKKEGPSCGVAIVSVLLSLLLNKVVDDKITFTGEISLKGNILPVGGIKEKVIAAYNRGIKKVYLPSQNKYDLDNIPNYIKKKLDLVLVDNYEEIYNDIFK